MDMGAKPRKISSTGKEKKSHTIPKERMSKSGRKEKVINSTERAEEEDN